MELIAIILLFIGMVPEKIEVPMGKEKVFRFSPVILANLIVITFILLGGLKNVA